MRKTKTVTLVLAAIILWGCSAHRVTTNPNPQAVTPMEQANFDNAQIAIHNRAIAKTIIAAHDAGFIETEYFDKLTAGQIKLTRAQSDLTPLLKDQATAMANADKIKAIRDEAVATVRQLVADGTVGVKNPQSKDALQQDVTAIGGLVDSITSLLTTAGVLK